MIYGEAVQMVAEDGEPFTIREGDTVHIPAGAYHWTFNATWRPLRLIVTYTPGGEETASTSCPTPGSWSRMASSSRQIDLMPVLPRPHHSTPHPSSRRRGPRPGRFAVPRDGRRFNQHHHNNHGL